MGTNYYWHDKPDCPCCGRSDETKVYKSDDLRSKENDSQGPLLLIDRKMLDAFRASNEDELQGHSSK